MDECVRRFDPVNETFPLDSTFGRDFADTASSVGEIMSTDSRGQLWLQAIVHNRVELGVLKPHGDGGYAWHSEEFSRAESFGPVFTIYPDEMHHGVVWFGGAEGILRYDSTLARIRTVEYSALIRRVTMSGDSLLFGGSALPANSPTLSYASNDLQFECAAPSYDGVTDNRFQYHLDGYDAHWSDWTAEARKEYTNLSAGRYLFRVRAKNSHGAVSSEAVYRFSVLPPFWATWWFRSIVVLLFLSVGPFIYFRRVRQLKRAQQQQQQFSRQLMESQESERKRIAGELHDSIGQSLLVIKNRAALGIQDVSNMTKALKQFDEISATVTDALSEVRYIAHNLHPYQLENIGLAAALRSMLTKIAESTSIKISGEIGDVDGMVLPKNEINVYRIIQEAMNNVLKHSEASEATVTVAAENSTLVITIEDNGKGFDPKADKKSGGMGVKGIDERVNILNGSYAISSSPGGGTTVEVRIPVELMS